MNGTIASRNADDRFGPAFEGPPRIFDFTLLFEDSFLVIAPASLFLVAACVRAFWLHGAPARVVLSNGRLYKVVSSQKVQQESA
jgi:ATP-binding cassette subfamily C (CFTR/MRP) protein 1